MPEVIVVDAHLFVGDAFSLVASLRGITEVPILMLSGPSESAHRVRPLTRGADDYIAAPFDWEEVGAYIRARLRHPGMEKRDVVTYADVEIDVSRRKAARAGNPLDLSAHKFDLLLTLACHPDQVLPRSKCAVTVCQNGRGWWCRHN